MFLRRFLPLFVLVQTAWGLPAAWAADQVAVAVYASDAQYQKYERAVLARMEAVLTDAGITVLDEDKAKKLRTGWVDLADPSHMVTAEEFIQKAGKYDVQRVYRVSFNAGITHPLGLFFTATSAVQIRVIDFDARVKPASSSPMGTKGFPPSDALTSDAALVNALQRAVDSAAEVSGLTVAIPTIARSIPLGLESVSAPPSAAPLPVPAASAIAGDWVRAASLYAEDWKKEDPACQSVSDDGQMGVLGGYVSEFRRWEKLRLYGSRLHLIDIHNVREQVTFTLHGVGQRASGENGSSEPLACLFLGNWRYLVGMSGNKLACFDVERGLETCSIPLDDAPARATLSIWQAGDQRYVRSESDKGIHFYRIVVQKTSPASPLSTTK